MLKVERRRVFGIWDSFRLCGPGNLLIRSWRKPTWDPDCREAARRRMRKLQICLVGFFPRPDRSYKWLLPTQWMHRGGCSV